jgi:hypothetical protein
MSFDLKGQIRQKSREEWGGVIKECWTDVRIWVQENGEKAAAVGLALGIIAVLFYKLVVFLAVVGMLLGFGVWFIALPDHEMKALRAKDPEKKTDSTTEKSSQ